MKLDEPGVDDVPECVEVYSEEPDIELSLVDERQYSEGSRGGDMPG